MEESQGGLRLKLTTENSFMSDDIKETVVTYGENFKLIEGLSVNSASIASQADVKANNAIEVSSEAIQIADTTARQLDDILRDEGMSDAELVAYRTNRKTGKTFSTAGERADNEFEQINTTVSDIVANVRDFGFVGDGITDDSQAINDAIAYYGLRGGAEIRLPSVDILINDTINISHDNIKLTMQSGGKIRLGDGLRESETNHKWAMRVANDIFKHTTFLTTNYSNVDFKAKKGVIWIGVEDIANIEVGDLIYIKGDFSTSPWRCDNRGVAVKGETNLVAFVDTFNKKVQLDKALSDDWTSAENATIEIVKPIKNVVIDGVNIVGQDDANFRGIAIRNTINGSIKNCHVKNCGVTSIESARSYTNTIAHNHVKNAWNGDRTVSDLALNGLGYALRAVEDTCTLISKNNVDIARHSVDISGNYPAHTIVVEGNICSVPAAEYGNFSTHGAAEDVTFLNNVAIGGQSGFLIRGENVKLHGNRTVGTARAVYSLGRNIEIHDNDFDGYLALVPPELNTDDTYIRLVGNRIRAAQMMYLTTSDKVTSVTKICNLQIKDNTLHSIALTSQKAINTDYINSTSVSLAISFQFYGNEFYTSTGVKYLGGIAETGRLVIERWTQSKTDTLCVVNAPTNPAIGQQYFAKDEKLFKIHDGTNFVAQAPMYFNVGNPNGFVVANFGAFCTDTTNNKLFFKQTGVGNGGWKEVALV